MAVDNTFEILIYPGLHSRPGKEFVNLCMEYESKVTLEINGNQFDGKSILSLFKNKPSQSEIVRILIEGNDENELMEKIVNWQTKSYKSKEDLDNDNTEEELLQALKLVIDE